MKHARPDYDRIQDPAGLIPFDEPVFLLRAQDQTAADTVADWIRRNRELDDCDPFAIAAALKHVELMRAWPHKKTADVTAETVTHNLVLTEEWLRKRGVLMEEDDESLGLSYSPAVCTENHFGVVRYVDCWQAVLSDEEGESQIYLGDVTTRGDVERWIRLLNGC